MPELNATILIPDISGFTKFMTSTELAHSSRAINMLIDEIINSVGDEYEVSEIEGDAVLLIRKGPAPTQKEVEDTCLRIFNDFHFRRKWMQKYAVCPCEACQGLAHLSLKFVAHHGPLAEIKVGKFIKQSGPEMIVAHRLLKNSIESHEYLLLTDRILTAGPPANGEVLSWNSSFEEYESIGKIPFHFSLLQAAKLLIPEPPEPDYYPLYEASDYRQMNIKANFKEVYITVMSVPTRNLWVPGLRVVVQDVADVFVGNIHHCSFDGYSTVVSAIKMDMTPEKISYSESCHINGTEMKLVYEYGFQKANDDSCDFSVRFLNVGQKSLTKDESELLNDRTDEMVGALRSYCEGKGGAIEEQIDAEADKENLEELPESGLPGWWKRILKAFKF